ncbi:MAG TPA: hypothetical protein VJ831_00520 [Jatrophihabitantaceae bacterium]|nr:hypothetical protein [Jatrophihabitantaceae bacterium]
MAPLPMPFRAALGIVATVREEAKHLPDRAIELPMLAVSQVLQVSLRAQQRYATLAAKGDELLSRRQTTDEPPDWATFDDPVAVQDLEAAAEPDRKPKSVRPPRNGKPSPFDAIGDE